jgi:starch synthase (maltosyl-transferring)
VIVAVNLDPRGMHEGEVTLPLTELGLTADSEILLEEAFTRSIVACRGTRQRLRLDPETNPAMIFRLLTADPA